MTFDKRTIGVAIGTVLTMSTAAVAQHGHAAPPHASAKPAKTTTAPAPKTTTTTTTTTTTSPIATKIESHPQLASRLTAMLPQGMTLQQAAAGFRNQGQFIAALHVSQNLGIPFATLKSEMTGQHPRSLGQAIHDLRPTADTNTAVKKATKQAHNDVDSDK